MDRGTLAKEYFLKGYNCSQAVLLAFSDRTGLDENTAARIASSFGGGMGRMREVCGSFSGMLLVFGILRGYDAADATAKEDKKTQYECVQELARRFREEFGSIICRELLTGSAQMQIKAGERADSEQISAMLSDSAIPTQRTEAYYKKRPCPELVEEGARILEAYLEELERNSNEKKQ
ncbi:MAG: C_GCAxxG_C_C family protein [Clostridia bacterium]|nr:C_GCAxxG_C_C family protein [Clostridia bacterium]